MKQSIYQLGGAVPGTILAYTSSWSVASLTNTSIANGNLPEARYQTKGTVGPDNNIYIVLGVKPGPIYTTSIIVYYPANDVGTGEIKSSWSTVRTEFVCESTGQEIFVACGRDDIGNTWNTSESLAFSTLTSSSAAKGNCVYSAYAPACGAV